jgi:tetratricopeptide (TPR) repeat protein
MFLVEEVSRPLRCRSSKPAPACPFRRLPVRGWLYPKARGVLLLALSLSSLVAAQTRAAQDSLPSIVAALRNHDFKQALSESQSALSINPRDYRIWTLRGMAFAALGNITGALSNYQHALRLSSDYLPALEGAAQTEVQMGRDAKPLLEKILAQRPDDPASHLLLGILEYGKKDCAGAIESFGKASPLLASQPGALTEDGICLAALNRNDDAVIVFRQVLALRPNDDSALYNVALAQYAAHRFDEASQAVAPLTRVSVPNPDVLVLAAEISEAIGETDHALMFLRRALLANPKDLDAYLQFASLSFDHASPRVGIDILNAGIGQLPQQPQLYLVRGILLAQSGEFARAVEDFDTASDLDPRLQFLGEAQGLMQSQQHNAERAIEHFRNAVKVHPNDAYGWYLLAEALAAEDQREGRSGYGEEVRAARRAVRLDPKLVEAYDLLSGAYYSSGNYQDSIAQSRIALEHDAKDQAALYHLILALRKTGRDEDARALVQQLLELRSESKIGEPPSHRYLLYEQPNFGAAMAAPDGSQ